MEDKDNAVSHYGFIYFFLTEDHLLITNLRPAIPYTVVVEARKMEKYKDVDEGKFKEFIESVKQNF